MTETCALGKLDKVLRGKHYSRSTRKTYAFWVRRYCQALRGDDAVKRERDSSARVTAFLSSLAGQQYSASSQNQAFNALIFFYRHVQESELRNVDALRAKKPQRIREAAHPEDTKRFLGAVSETSGYPMRLIAHMYYECGLRLSEATRIRLKDVEPRSQHLMVRNGKGGKDRMVCIPCSLIFAVQHQMKRARVVSEADRRNELPVPLPGRLARKYPTARFSESWAWLFPAHRPCEHPRGSGKFYRWHVHESTVSKAIRAAARRVGMDGRLSAHVLRHSYATDLLNQGANVRQIQQQLGHKHMDTTMGYLHVPEGARLWSPLQPMRMQMRTERDRG